MQEWKDAPEWMTRKSERCAKDFFALIEIAKRSELTLTIYAAQWQGSGGELNLHEGLDAKVLK
jgi:hypothetical protein